MGKKILGAVAVVSLILTVLGLLFPDGFRELGDRVSYVFSGSYNSTVSVPSPHSGSQPADSTTPATSETSTPLSPGAQVNVWVDRQTNVLGFSGITPVNIEPVRDEPNNERSQLFNFYRNGVDSYFDITFDGATIKGIAYENESGLHRHELNGQNVTVRARSVAVFWRE